MPSYQTETLDGEAWTPTTPLRNYTLKGKPEVSTAYRTGDLSRIGIEELQKQPHREDTWITVITGTESNSILYENLLMAPDPKTHGVDYTVELEQRTIGPSSGGVYKKSTKTQRQKQEKEEKAAIVEAGGNLDAYESSSSPPPPTLIKEYRKMPR